MSGTLTSLCVFVLLLYPVKPQDDAPPLLDEFGGGFSAAGNSMSLDCVAGVDNNGATGTKETCGGLIVGVSISMAVILLTALLFYIVRRKKTPDLVEDRDHDIGPHKATDQGSKEKERIGSGGSGPVYKGIPRNPDTQVAVNRVSKHPKQDLRAIISAVPIKRGNVKGGNVKGGDVEGGDVNVDDVIGGSVTGAEVTGGSVTGDDVSGGSGTGGDVTGGDVTGGKVTGSKVKCGKVATGNGKEGSVKGGKVTGGDVKGGKVTGGDFKGR